MTNSTKSRRSSPAKAPTGSPPAALSVNVAALLQLLKFASLINRPMQSDLAAKHNLTMNEVRVMMCVSGEAPIGGQAIADMMAMPPMNVSRAMASLSQRGWTEAAPDTGNGRWRPVRLSGAGWAVYQQMMPDMAAIADRLLHGVDVTTDDGLATTAALLVERLEQWREGEQG